MYLVIMQRMQDTRRIYMPGVQSDNSYMYFTYVKVGYNMLAINSVNTLIISHIYINIQQCLTHNIDA